jgi:hypothetical protein
MEGCWVVSRGGSEAMGETEVRPVSGAKAWRDILWETIPFLLFGVAGGGAGWLLADGLTWPTAGQVVLAHLGPS